MKDKKDKIVFGINLSHDISCAALVNGEVKVAIEEERLNKVKHCDGKTLFGKILPYLGINYCLNYLGIKANDVDLWVTNACFPSAITVFKQHLFGIPEEKIIDVELPGHHLAHAYSTFYAAPYEEAAVMVFDVNGGFTQTTKENYSIYLGNNKGITPLVTDLLQLGEMSVAELYVLYAAILQLSPRETGDYGKDDSLSSGGKLMGLSGHAHPDNLKKLFEKADFLTKLSKKDEYQPNPLPTFLIENENEHYVIKIRKLIDYFLKRKLFTRVEETKPFEAVFGWDIQKYLTYNYRKDNLKEPHNLRLAGEAQGMLEEAIIMVAKLAYEKTKSKNLCVAGGSMLNVVANTKILQQTPFENIFVQPASNDGGNAVGCAFYGYHKILKQPGRFYLTNKYSTCLGWQYSDQEIDKAVNQGWVYPFTHTKTKNDEEQIKIAMSYLLDDRIIAVFKGRSEFGPRALGSRSFIASPMEADMLTKMNDLKEREWYRPVAPLVLEEEFLNFFDAPFSKAPFMTLNALCKEHTRKLAPAICHVDGSSRVQTVNKDDNPFIYKLLKAFFEETGVPILINTSFNVQGPILEAPEFAIETLLSSWQNVNCLILEKYILETEKIGSV